MRQATAKLPGWLRPARTKKIRPACLSNVPYTRFGTNQAARQGTLLKSILVRIAAGLPGACCAVVMSAYGGSSGSSQAPQGAVKPAVSSAAPASSPTVAVPQRGNTSQAIIQRTVPGLPSGELFWRLETFAGKADA